MRGAQLSSQLLDRFVQRACAVRDARSKKQDIGRFLDDQWHRLIPQTVNKPVALGREVCA
jgi:hypothetical protein